MLILDEVPSAGTPDSDLSHFIKHLTTADGHLPTNGKVSSHPDELGNLVLTLPDKRSVSYWQNKPDALVLSPAWRQHLVQYPDTLATILDALPGQTPMAKSREGVLYKVTLLVNGEQREYVVKILSGLSVGEADYFTPGYAQMIFLQYVRANCPFRGIHVVPPEAATLATTVTPFIPDTMTFDELYTLATSTASSYVRKQMIETNQDQFNGLLVEILRYEQANPDKAFLAKYVQLVSELAYTSQGWMNQVIYRHSIPALDGFIDKEERGYFSSDVRRNLLVSIPLLQQLFEKCKQNPALLEITEIDPSDELLTNSLFLIEAVIGSGPDLYP